MATILRHKIGEASYKDHELVNMVTTMGRSSSNDIVINDTSLSRLHMRLENRDGQFYLVDNNSSNGTFLNRRKITEAPLKDGDEIQAGRIHFAFVQKLETSGSPTRPMATVSNDPGMASTMNLHINLENEDLSRTRSAPAFNLMMDTPLADQMPTGDVTQARQKVQEMSNPTSADDEPAGMISVRVPPQLPPVSATGPVQESHPSFGQTPLERATPLKRLIAVIIDCVILMCLTLPGLLARILSLPSLVFGGLYAASFAISLAYYLVGWNKYGKTPGKHFMGLRVIEAGHPERVGISPNAAILRMVGFFIASIPCYLGHLFIFFNEEGLGIQDKLAKTEVIQDHSKNRA